jgi:hypothetical protein
MEAGTGEEVPVESRLNTYWGALKVVALPVGSVVSLVAVVFWFAADAWIRNIVQEEIAAVATGTDEASTMLANHASRLEVHERDIGDNEEDIEKVDDKFTDFVREILAKL